MTLDLRKQYHDLFAKKAHDEQSLNAQEQAEASARQHEEARVKALRQRFTHDVMKELEGVLKSANGQVAAQGYRLRLVPTSFDDAGDTMPATAIQLAASGTIKMSFLNVHLERDGRVVFVAVGDVDEHQKRDTFRREMAIENVTEDYLSGMLFDFVKHAIGG